MKQRPTASVSIRAPRALHAQNDPGKPLPVLPESPVAEPPGIGGVLPEARGDLSVSPFCINGQQLVVISFPTMAAAPDKRSLSPAEKHVAQLILQGHSNAQIATFRRTALRTTANQVASIFRKYGVNDRAELAMALLTGRS